MSAIDYRGALEAVERILNRGGEPRDVLGAVLSALRERGVAYAAVRLADGSTLESGVPVEALSAPVVGAGVEVGMLELAVADAAFVARVATLVSAYARGAASA